MKQSKNFYAGFARNLEKPQNFIPLKSDYRRFVEERESMKPKRTPRIPEVGAKLPSKTKDKEAVRKLEQRMRESLGDKPKTNSVEKKPTEGKKEQKPKYIAGYEKAGKPSKIKVGSNAQSSEKQLEARKQMLERRRYGKMR